MIVNALIRYAWFACIEGDSTFSLHRVDKPAEVPETWIYFEVSEPDDVVNDLMDEGIVFQLLPNDKPQLQREARLKDPEKNQPIHCFASENRKGPP